MSRTAELADEVRPTAKTPALEIAPTWSPGHWRSHGVDCPFVFRCDGRLGMTVVGWDGIGYQTGLAWHDGESWSEPSLIFGRDQRSTYRRHNAALTSILRDHRLYGDGELIAIDGWYHATYHAYPDPGYEAGSAIIGIIRSRDLVTWEEFGEVLRPEDGGSWERGGLYKSWLLRHDDRYWLFYNAKDVSTGRWIEQTGAAVSDDLRHWRRVSDEPLLPVGPAGAPDDRFASDPCILRADDGTWLMFYFGLRAGGHATDLLATSRDLIGWTKHPEPLIDVGPPGSIDDWHAHKPTVIFTEGRLDHYYCAVQRLTQPVRIGADLQPERRGIARAWVDRRPSRSGPPTHHADPTMSASTTSSILKDPSA